jgi:hypothetical protein
MLTPMGYELWDAELGLSLGTYVDENAALEAVRQLCATSSGSRAPLGLLEVAEQATIVATGDQLVDRAFSRA